MDRRLLVPLVLRARPLNPQLFFDFRNVMFWAFRTLETFKPPFAGC